MAPGAAMTQYGIHRNQPIYTLGARLEEAKAAVIMLHGRGASAQDILQIASQFSTPDIAYFAPQAYQHSWYPHRFLAPLEENEPWLTSALDKVDLQIAELQQSGMALTQIGLLGFSQGACLAAEYAARHPRRYGGVIIFTGGLIGPEDDPLDRYPKEADFDQTPVFIGCSDVDFHIPLSRAEETARILESMNARVDLRIYPNMGHIINQDEMTAAQELLTTMISG
jgi:predicted esterase